MNFLNMDAIAPLNIIGSVLMLRNQGLEKNHCWF